MNNKLMSELFALTSLQWGYLAGIIDGEGTITLTKRGKRRDIEARIIITNTHKPLLEMLKEWLCGCVKKISMDTRKRKQCYRLEISKQSSVIGLLCNLLGVQHYWQVVKQGSIFNSSLLHIKRQQAKLTLEYMELRHEVKTEHTPEGNWISNPAYLKAKKERLPKIVDEVRELNKKGRKIETEK